MKHFRKRWISWKKENRYILKREREKKREKRKYSICSFNSSVLVIISAFISFSNSITFFLAISLFFILKLTGFSFILLFTVSILKSSSIPFILFIFSFSIALSFFFVDSITISVSNYSILFISFIASFRSFIFFIIFISLKFLIYLGLDIFILCKTNFYC